MASPQTEDGYTRISNEIMEALMKFNLSAYESRVLWFIFRKTYGFKKKADWITLSQFSKAIGLDRRNVHRSIKKLLAKNIIVVHRDDGIRVKYGFQKDYSKWKVSSKQTTVIHRDDRVVSKEMTRVVSKETPTKDTITKDTITKEKNYVLFSKKTPEVEFYITKKKKKLQGPKLERFTVAWEAFGYKRGKADAADTWMNIKNMDENLFDKIITAAKVTADNRENGDSSKTPQMFQGWLSGKRWEDEKGEEHESIYDREIRLIRESQENDQVVQQERLNSGSA